VTTRGLDSSVQMQRRADVLPFQHAPEPLDLVRGREKGMVAVNRRVFALKDDAELLILSNSRTAFEPVKRYTVANSATWAQPAISGNRIYVKDLDSLTLFTVE